MKFDIKSLDLGGKLIVVSLGLAIISLLFSWVDVGFASQNGIQQAGYLLLIPLIYPAYHILKGTDMNKKLGYVCCVLTLFFTIAYISSKSVEFFGESINAAGIGPYLFLIATIALGVGIFKLTNVIVEIPTVVVENENKDRAI